LITIVSSSTVLILTDRKGADKIFVKVDTVYIDFDVIFPLFVQIVN
jgi:hypothetical protein